MKASRKYTVFVSATQRDLLDERQEVAGEILKAGHIPCGMEQFSASGHPSWTIIENTINICDYYVLVIAGRYGSVDATTGISWTEREYDYATKLGLPVLAFIRDDKAITKADTEEDPEKLRRLESFIERVEGTWHRETWGSKEDLRGRVAVALLKRIKEDEASGTPRIGWFRGDDLPSQSPRVAAPVELQLVRRDIEITQERHLYKMEVRLKNVTKERLDDWYLEVEAPMPLFFPIPHASTHAGFVEERNGRAFFRAGTVSTPRWNPILSGDTVTFPLTYRMDRETREKQANAFGPASISEWVVSARAFVGGKLVDTAQPEKAQNF